MALAITLRPTNLNQLVGQEHILGQGKPLRKAIEDDQLKSIILYGPAGTGKTTIAEIITNTTKKKVIKLNASSLKINDIRNAGNQAKKEKQPTIIFMDEIHRMTSVQQAALLSDMEEEHIILIGATTENPFHSLETPILSRSMIYCLEPLKKKDLLKILLNGIQHYEKQNIKITITEKAINHLINVTCGDGRKLLTILETIINLVETNDVKIDEEIMKVICPSKHYVYSKDAHYDLASWLQGAIQASDPDAAVYALAKWLETGEDPRYIARRLLISASEDAAGSPEAATIANNAYLAACQIGRPECDIILSHAVVTIASCPRDKSAATAIWDALKDIRNQENVEVPPEMKDSHYPGAKELGRGTYQDGMNQKAYVGIKKVYYRKWEENDDES